jgi:Carboxypeptidase regulatory-like domain
MRKKSIGASALWIALLFGGVETAWVNPGHMAAQATNGAIVGTVADPTGAAISGASVKAVNAATSIEATAQSNSNGEFRFPNLPAGTYNITASASGFTPFVLQNFILQLNNTSTIKLVLPVGTQSSSVEVSAQASVALDTTTVQLQTTFEQKQIQDLPTASIGLGVLNLSLLSPGVASSGGIGAGTGPSVGGQRPRANNFNIEGIDNNDKSVTGPLVYVPNDAVGEFTLITNQFSPEFGHSAGGQFNSIVLSGTNKFHGRAYEYFQNRDLNAIDASVARSFAPGVKPENPRFDFNRYGGQVGGPILKDKLFFFVNYERQTTGQSETYALCTPTADGLNTLKNFPGLDATNLGVYAQYTPVSPSQVDATADAACGNQATGPQYLTIYSGPLQTGTPTNIPLGNFQVAAPAFTNFDALTTSGDYTISANDTLRLRYLYNTEGTEDTAAYLPAFFQTTPNRFHLIAISEYHTFTPSLTNEVRVGYNRYSNVTPSGNYSFPGLDSFPNLTFVDQGFINYGPDGNAPQSTLQNLYQLTDNITWVKGNHTLKFGFDGRKYISPQSFTQRVRGDYEWLYLDDYLHDISPTYFGERSTGDFFYYGDQTAFYGYGNDTWRVTPKLSLNYGLRYEFTAVPVGARTQEINSAASVPGLITFSKPEPQKANFVPRVGFAFAPDENTSIRAGFGMAYDVYYDNLGILSFPPQFSSTNDVDVSNPTPGFLAGGGLPPGTGSLATFPTIAAQRAATSAYIPNQKLPYSETWSLGIQHAFAKSYTAEVRYLGTRGIHLSTQIQLNKEARVTSGRNLPTYLQAPSQGDLDALPLTLADLTSTSAVVPAFLAAGFTSNLTSYQPYSSSNYNGLSASLIRSFHNGLQMNLAYTWSKAMDDATADVFSTVLTPRRPQNFQNVAADYSRSALDHTNRFTAEVIYDLPFFKNGNWLLKNALGNWEVAPIYTYQSPEYVTAQSGTDSNLNGDAAPDRTVINPNGVKGTGSGVTALTNSNGDTVAYLAANPDAYYIQAGQGAYATAGRNTLPIRPIDNLDITAVKRISFTERYAFEFQAQAFNSLNHPQFISGSINTINSVGDTSSSNFLLPNNSLFNQPEKVFSSNSRTLQLTAKFIF